MTIIPMSRRTPALALAVATALMGCAGGSADSRPQVVASAYPFAFVAERVGGPYVDVENLTSPGVEPHDIELTPQQVADVSDAELVIVERGFQPAVDDAVDQRGWEGVLDVAETVTLEDTGFSESGSLDPHVWLDPVRMVALTGAVADRVATTVPDHADDIRVNADRLEGQLRALEDAYSEGLADCTHTTFVTSHAAFGYLAQRYGLTMVAIAGLDPTSEPSAAQQAEIADIVEREGVTTIFTETLVSPAVADSVADETGATVATLDPIEGLSDATADQDYLTLMRSNLAALRQANGCR